MLTPDQCAIATDGNLLDESEIVWYNDAEDLDPIAAPSTSSMSKATSIHAFFKGGPTPGHAVFVAGGRRSSRVSKPSKRVCDAEAQAESSKCPRAARKQVIQSESEDESSVVHASDAGGDTDVDMGDAVTAEDAYASTKSLGDQDCKVRLLNAA